MRPPVYGIKDMKGEDDAFDPFGHHSGCSGGYSLADQQLHTDGYEDQENLECRRRDCRDSMAIERLRSHWLTFDDTYRKVGFS
jgi:hypothetical protein